MSAGCETFASLYWDKTFDNFKYEYKLLNVSLAFTEKTLIFEWKTNHKRDPEHTDTVLITRETRDPGGKPSPNAGIKENTQLRGGFFAILFTHFHVLQRVCVFQNVTKFVCF